MDSTIIELAAAAALGTKILIDALRLAVGLTSRYIPLLAVVLGIVVVALVHLANGGGLATGAQIATVALAGIVAGGGAVGVTELQKQVERRE
ncbi:MAG: hypothetical protein H6637_05325 [Ardenticatenales bacterium]|nr:hypothetical protein [Ardenticatenales bacterium]